MDSIISDMLAQDPLIVVLMGLIGLALAALGSMSFVQARMDLRRRAAAGLPAVDVAATAPGGTSANRIMDRIQANFGGIDTKEGKLIRKQLIQAGFFDPRAVPVYFASRLGAAVVFAILTAVLTPIFLPDTPIMRVWMYTGGGALIGYLLPSFLLKKRLNQRILQHRQGFPDFMDLLVVCSEAGLSIEAAVDRIARELVDGYPSLAQNLYMASLEIRAGKSFNEALLRMSERLGIDEAAMLATLLQQSAELGTSLSLSLKVYSDEMRNKRMSRAEEKAYALPAKLVVPLTLFVFPVLIATLMVPVIIRVTSLN